MRRELISRAGLAKLEEQYKDFDEEIQNTLTQMGNSAKRDFDLRENPEFMELRVKAMHILPAQKERVYWQIRNACVIEKTQEYMSFDGTMVIVGSTVTFDMDGMYILYPWQFGG